MTMTDGQLLAYLGTDVRRWAEVFVQRVRDMPGLALDEGAMIGWFANAIETGRTAGRQELCPHPEDRLFVHGDLRICGSCGKGLSE